MAKSDALSPIPDPIRRADVEIYVADVNRLSQQATAARLMFAKSHAAGKPNGTSLSEALVDIEQLSRELCDRQDVVAPKSAADTLDVLYNRTYEAMHHIYALNALLEVISVRVDQGPDGPLISLVDLSREQLVKIRLAFYGEDMGP